MSSNGSTIRIAATLAFGVSIAAGLHPLGAQRATALAVDDILRLRSFPPVSGFVSATPDGRLIAYAVRDARDFPQTDTTMVYSTSGVFVTAGRETQIWVTDARGGTSRNVTGDRGSNWAPVWSPNGRRLAFYSDRDGVARLWLWERSTGALRRVTDAPVRPFYESPAWSPDGRRIAVKLLPEGKTVLDANRLTKRAESGRDSAVVPGATVAVFRSAARRDSATATAASTQAVVDTTNVDTIPPRPDALADMALVDVETGAVQRLGARQYVLWFAFSPDGASLAFAPLAGLIAGTQQGLADFIAAPVAGGAPRRLVTRARASSGLGPSASWSPDGRRLAYATNGPLADGDLYVIDVSSGQQRRVTGRDHPRFYSSNPFDLFWSPRGDALYFTALNRLWRASPDSGPVVPVTPERWDREVVSVVSDAARQVAWSPDGGRTLLVTTRDPATKQVGFYRVDVAARRSAKLREEPRFYGRYLQAPVVTADGSTVLFTSEDAQHPLDVWVADTGLRAARQLTRLNPGIDPERLGTARLIEYRGLGGAPLRGALLLPPGYQPGTRYPLIVRAYPGPFTHSDNVFRFGLDHAGDIGNMQLLATRGYAVLYPEVPQRPGTPLKDLVDGVNAAVDRAVDLGIADPDRLGIFGQSYGGYATVGVIARTPRFRAAVMSAGFADLVSFYGHMTANGLAGWAGWAETGQGLMGGTPWQYRDRYIENSPIFFLDRVETPLLIVHGEADNPQNADAVFVGLRRLGKEVEYRRYSGVGHVVSGPANLRDYWAATIRWFDAHLTPRPPASTSP